MMVAKKIKLVKKSGENTFACYPVSSADLIMYDETLTVAEVLNAIIDSVDQVENRLQAGSLYLRDSNGAIMYDESGIGIVGIL